MADINTIISNIEDGIGSLSANTVPGFASEAQKDTKSFLDQMKDDLDTWADQLAAKKINEDQFKSLLAGDDELLTMDELRKEGIKQAKLDSFKSGLFTLIVKVVTALI